MIDVQQIISNFNNQVEGDLAQARDPFEKIQITEAALDILEDARIRLNDYIQLIESKRNLYEKETQQ